MIEHFPQAAVLEANGVLIVSDQRAVIDCGCAAYVGIRTDRQEPTIVMCVCGCEHHGLGHHFTLLYRESLADPTGRPAVDVADELLGQAERYWAREAA